MSQIFISYSKKDEDFANKLEKDLSADGFDIWIDQKIEGGDSWRESIERNLKYADKVIMVISPNSLASDWVRHEGSVAYAWQKEIIPIMIVHVPSLPPWVEEIQCLDFYKTPYETALNNLIDKLKPKNYAQELLDQQFLIYQKNGDLLNATRLQVIEDEIDSLTISPEKKKFIELSRSVALHAKQKRQIFIAAGVFIFGIAVAITTLGVTGNLSRLFYRPLDMEMVDIQAGEFIMGSTSSDAMTADDEQPQRTVYLDAYRIGKFEVTNRQYLQCVKAGDCRSLSQLQTLESYEIEQPVTIVDWEDANALCRWYGYRLPTEAEWEKAARGDDGRIYPWGNQEPDCTRTNFKNCNKGVQSVGSYPDNVSPYGAYDMAGNVWEWVADWYAPDYYKNAPDENPPGPAWPEDDAYRRVVRGGSAFYSASNLRTANRRPNTPDTRNHNIGFRCAADALP